ncbi:unnamed protein product [Cunninghamella blakesleeana]
MKYTSILTIYLFIQVINASLLDFIKPPSERNPDKCEDYENEYYGDDNVGCGMSCQINGYFGSIQIRSLPRKLRTPKYDGAYCLAKVSKGPKNKSGIEFYHQGTCISGVCQETKLFPIPIDTAGAANGVSTTGVPVAGAPVTGSNGPTARSR